MTALLHRAPLVLTVGYEPTEWPCNGCKRKVPIQTIEAGLCQSCQHNRKRDREVTQACRERNKEEYNRAASQRRAAAYRAGRAAIGKPVRSREERRWKPEETAALLACIEQDLTLKEAAARIPTRSLEAVRTRAKDHHDHNFSGKAAKKKLATILELYSRGVSPRLIAAEVNTSRGQVYRILRQQRGGE